MIKKSLEEKIARWLWRYHFNQGEMVEDFEAHKKTWMKEAEKLLRLIRRDYFG